MTDKPDTHDIPAGGGEEEQDDEGGDEDMDEDDLTARMRMRK